MKKIIILVLLCIGLYYLFPANKSKDKITNSINLYEAVKENDIEKVKSIIEAGNFDINLSQNGLIPLVIAINNQNYELIKLLLKNGADLNYKSNENPKPPLLIAMEINNIDIFKILIRAGANYKDRIPVNIDENIKIPEGIPLSFYSILVNCDRKIPDFFISNNMLLNDVIKTEMFGYKVNMNIMQLAIQNTDLDTVKYLVEKGADLYDKAGGIFISLNWAIFSEKYDIVKYLIEKGVNVNYSENVFNYSPLMQAVEKDNINMAKLLLENGADPNHKSCEYEYIIRKTEDEWDPDVKYKLMLQLMNEKIEFGDFKENEYVTPLIIAQRNGYDEMVALLKKFGAIN